MQSVTVPVPLSGATILQAFQQLTFQHGLKVSAQERFRNISPQLENCSNALAQVLARTNPEFGMLPRGYFVLVCLDDSMVHRPEYTVSCMSNKTLAYFGDAALTLYLANLCVDRQASAEQYQNERSRCTSTAHLHAFFKRFFGAETAPPLVLIWQAVAESKHLQPSAKQAAQVAAGDPSRLSPL
jgi:hypothetical protein